MKWEVHARLRQVTIANANHSFMLAAAYAEHSSSSDEDGVDSVPIAGNDGKASPRQQPVAFKMPLAPVAKVAQSEASTVSSNVSKESKSTPATETVHNGTACSSAPRPSILSRNCDKSK